MSNVATVEKAQVIEPNSPLMPKLEASAVVSIIERAARDDTVNVEKMRELLAMRKEIMAQHAEQLFNEAMAKAQAEMRAVAADANNPQTRSRYASYFVLDRAVRPIYTRHGFSLSFDTEDGAPDQYVRVVCFVSCGGFTRKYRIDMPADGKGAKGGDVMTKTHAVGSGVSYGQRYLLKMIFNIAVGDDDDGNRAGSGERITAEQAGDLQAMIEDIGGTRSDALKRGLLRYMKVESLASIPAARHKDAVAALNAKRGSV